jgi:hypothetical protein
MRDAVIVDALRTPVGRYAGVLSPVRPDDLAARTIEAVVERNELDSASIDDAFEDVSMQLQDVEAIDEDRCLTVQRLVGRFRTTGIAVDGAWGAIVTVRRGKTLSAVGYATPRRAKRAAGLD